MSICREGVSRALRRCSSVRNRRNFLAVFRRTEASARLRSPENAKKLRLFCRLAMFRAVRLTGYINITYLHINTIKQRGVEGYFPSVTRTNWFPSGNAIKKLMLIQQLASYEGTL